MAGTIRQSGRIKIWDVTLTVATAGNSATATSGERFAGTVRKVELDPGDMSTSATLKGYEANTPLATGTRDHFIAYTFPASEVELVVCPLKATTTNDGSTATNPLNYVPHVVCDYLRLDLASATAADSTRVRVYVEVD